MEQGRDRYFSLVRLLFTGTVFLALEAMAFAHAVVMSSTPEDGSFLTSPPAEITLRFNAFIEKELTRLSLTRDGRKVPLSPLASDNDPPDTLTIPVPPLSPGQYMLQFRVLATDGHSTPGLIRFTIRGPASR